MIKLSEITDEILMNIMSKKPGGILIILPTNKFLQNESDLWKTVSRFISNFFLKKKIKIILILI